jgi:hypothetical protein
MRLPIFFESKQMPKVNQSVIPFVTGACLALVVAITLGASKPAQTNANMSLEVVPVSARFQTAQQGFHQFGIRSLRFARSIRLGLFSASIHCTSGWKHQNSVQ